MYISTVEHTLAEAINSGGILIIRDTGHELDSNFILKTDTEQDVLQHVTELQGGFIPGMDGVSAQLLKTNKDPFIQPSPYLINLSVVVGEFPDVFKLAKGVLIY